MVMVMVKMLLLQLFLLLQIDQTHPLLVVLLTVSLLVPVLRLAGLSFSVDMRLSLHVVRYHHCRCCPAVAGPLETTDARVPAAPALADRSDTSSAGPDDDCLCWLMCIGLRA